MSEQKKEKKVKKFVLIGIAAAVLILVMFLAWKHFTAKKAAPPPAATAEKREEKEKTAPAPEEKVEPKAKIERGGDIKINSLTPSRIASDYKPELTVLVIEGENFGLLPEVWIGDFRVAPDAMVSTESRITIRALRLYGTGRLWPKKWTVTVKRSDGQIATTALTVGFDSRWWLAIIAIFLIIVLAIFVIPKLWKKGTKKPAQTAPTATTSGQGVGTP